MSSATLAQEIQALRDGLNGIIARLSFIHYGLEAVLPSPDGISIKGGAEMLADTIRNLDDLTGNVHEQTALADYLDRAKGATE